MPNGLFDNHERVRRINAALADRGLITWFDGDRMHGQIVSQMCNGIDASKCVVVFITSAYITKVGGANAADNCKLEFNYAMRRKTNDLMVAVVMESACARSSDWTGPLGMALGGQLYVPFFDENDFQRKVDEVFDQIIICMNICDQRNQDAAASAAGGGVGALSSAVGALTLAAAGGGGGGGGAHASSSSASSPPTVAAAAVLYTVML